MKKQKVELGFGGGYSDIILDVAEGDALSYERDRKKIHEKWGGNAYYTSCSGKSGEGFIEQRVDAPCIKIGCLRIDTRLFEASPKVLSYDGRDFQLMTEYDRDVWGHVRDTYIAMDDMVVKVPPYRIMETVKNWDAIRKQATWISFNGGKYKLLVNDDFDRVYEVKTHIQIWANLLRNVEALPHPEMDEFEDRLRSWTGVIWTGSQWKSGPKWLPPDIVSAQWGDNKDLTFPTYANMDEVLKAAVAAFELKLETDYTVLAKSGKKDAVSLFAFAPGKNGRLTEYEVEASILDTQDAIAQVIAGLRRKVRLSLLEERSERMSVEDLKNALLKLPSDACITLEDSLEAGNCRPGTEDFARQIGLRCGSCLVSELMKKVTDTDLQNTYVRRALSQVLLRYEEV